MNQFRRVRRKARYAKNDWVKPAVSAARVSLRWPISLQLTIEEGEPGPAC